MQSSFSRRQQTNRAGRLPNETRGRCTLVSGRDQKRSLGSALLEEVLLTGSLHHPATCSVPHMSRCPKRKQSDGSPAEPKETEINSIINDAVKLKQIRSRLSDISWWMRLMCQKIAVHANAEDETTGRFFQGRFRSIRILDEAGLLACAAYVDLNPIRAAMAQTLVESDYTSAQRRIESLQSPDRQPEQRGDRFLNFSLNLPWRTEIQSLCR